MTRNDLSPYLLPIFVCVSARPEEMCTGAHSSALIRFLQKFRCSKCTLSPQRFMILFTEALHPLKSTNDQGDGSKLCFGITDFIFIQRKCLVNKKQKRPLLLSAWAFPKVLPTKSPSREMLQYTRCWPLPCRGTRQLVWKDTCNFQQRSLFQLLLNLEFSSWIKELFTPWNTFTWAHMEILNLIST